MSILDIQRSFGKPGCQIAMAISGAAIALTFVFTGAPMCAQPNPDAAANAPALIAAGQPISYQRIEEMERSMGAVDDPIQLVQAIGSSVDQAVQQAVVVRLADEAGVQVDEGRAKSLYERQVEDQLQMQKLQLQMSGQLKQDATDKDFEDAFEKAAGRSLDEAKAEAVKQFEASLGDAAQKAEILNGFKGSALLEKIAGGIKVNEADLRARYTEITVNRFAASDFSKPEAERMESAKKARERLEKGEDFAKVHQDLLGDAPPAAQPIVNIGAQAPELQFLAEEEKGAVSEAFIEQGVPVVYQLASKKENLPPDFEKEKQRYIQQEQQGLASQELQKRVDAAVKASGTIEWKDAGLKAVYEASKQLADPEAKTEDIRAKMEEIAEIQGADNANPRYATLARYALYDSLVLRETGDAQKELEDQRAEMIEAVLAYVESVDLRLKLAEAQFKGEDETAGVSLLGAAEGNNAFGPQNESYIQRIEGLAKQYDAKLTAEDKESIRKEIERWRREKAEAEKEQKELEAERAAAAKALDEEEAKAAAEEKKQAEAEAAKAGEAQPEGE